MASSFISMVTVWQGYTATVSGLDFRVRKRSSDNRQGEDRCKDAGHHYFLHGSFPPFFLSLHGNIYEAGFSSPEYIHLMYGYEVQPMYAFAALVMHLAQPGRESQVQQHQTCG
jgi:hypothetical protein